ncbi:MAG: PP2C family protein-serine/threonine phosphatase [Pyrinomonadaceae bacterium MAG19_C2-C3]|nr:PP2C family protein-serine/threonine phosphatase [Pyrinomonadaceae bacterium MAG19_C2-C3]
MKALKFTFRRYYGTLKRQLRKAAGRVSPASALFIVEAVAVCGALSVVLTGSRAASLDSFGGRADIGVIVTAAMLLIVLHFYINSFVLARLDRRFPVRAYDERRILFDLGQAARGVTNTNQIYDFVVREIADALRATNVSVFVRDEMTGDYVCRVSSEKLEVHHGAATPVSDRLTLQGNALIVKRLHGLTAPLGLTPADLETWRRGGASFSVARRAERERECATLSAVDARLVLGITIHERLVGILSLGLRQNSRSYSTEDKRMLMSVASQLAFIIENAKLTERMVAEEGLRRELALAREVQQRLLPEAAPHAEAFELAAFCQPARAVGGDYYDFLALDDNKLGIAIADVAGKGISAALLMSSVQASLRSQAMNHRACDDGRSLAELVSTMNHLMHRSTGAASYVTFFYAQFDEKLRTLTYVNAGHNPPMLVRAKTSHNRRASGGLQARSNRKAHWSSVANGVTAAVREAGYSAGVAVLEVEMSENDYTNDINFREQSFEVRELTTGGAVLGVFEDCYYEQETLRMESGDLLVLFTDGLTESLDREGDEFGEERLRDTLTACAHLSADEVRDEVAGQVREWSAGAAQHDDLTFVVMKVK